MQAPDGWQEWQKLLAQDIMSGSAKRMLPYWFLLSAAVGGCTGYLAPLDLWAESDGRMLNIYAAAVTLGGIVIALTWSAFAKIMECASAPRFSSY